jgi:hypothetical protein
MTTNGPALLIPEPATASTNAMPSELHDIRPAVEIVSLWEYAGWALLILTLILVGYFLARHFLKKRDQRITEEASRPSTPAHVLARRRLDAALEQLHDPRLFCGLVSDAVRVYLDGRFDLRAPDRTTEEFFDELQSSASLNVSQKQTLHSFLQQCDLAKFAKADMLGKELKSLYDIGVQFVRETEPEAITAPGAKLEEIQAPKQQISSDVRGHDS